MKYTFENCRLTVEKCKVIKSFCVSSFIVHKDKNLIDFLGEGQAATIEYSESLTGFATFAEWKLDIESKMAACCGCGESGELTGDANIANQQIQTAVLEEIRDLTQGEIVNFGCYQLKSDATKKGNLVAVYNEDKTFDRYDLHLPDGTVQVVAITDVEECTDVAQPTCTFATVFYESEKGETVNNAVLLAAAANAQFEDGTIGGAVGISKVMGGLEPKGSNLKDGSKTTESQATSVVLNGNSIGINSTELVSMGDEKNTTPVAPFEVQVSAGSVTQWAYVVYKCN